MYAQIIGVLNIQIDIQVEFGHIFCTKLQRGTQAQDVRMKSCGLAESSCSSFRPQDFSQDDYFFRAFVFFAVDCRMMPKVTG